MAAALAAQSSVHFADFSADYIKTEPDFKPFPIINHVITDKEVILHDVTIF